MSAERPRIDTEDLIDVLEDPDHDDGSTARRRIGPRTLIVRYSDEADRIVVRSVSATRRRLRP